MSDPLIAAVGDAFQSGLWGVKVHVQYMDHSSHNAGGSAAV